MRTVVVKWETSSLWSERLFVSSINATHLVKGCVRSGFEVSSGTAWSSETHDDVFCGGTGSIDGFEVML